MLIGETDKYTLSHAWPGDRQAAVSLTYDDALSVHYRNVAPLLRSHGFRGTFYLPISSRFLDESDAWREVARQGHELGNHTLFHPCYGATSKEIAWLDKGYNLRDYSIRRWRDEIRVANWALQQIDGRTARTFGNTCGNRYVGEKEARVCLDSHILQHFIAARGSHVTKAIDPQSANMTNLGTVRADRRTFADLREELLRVRESGSWVIYTIHGVGSKDHEQFIDVTEHARLIEWLATQSEFWVAPVAEAASWLSGK